TGMWVLCGCQPMLPFRTLIISSLSFSARRVPSDRTLLIAAISNSSGPKRLAKAICWSRSRCWSGKISSAYLSQASYSAADVASSTFPTLMPRTTAPKVASIGSMSSVRVMADLLAKSLASSGQIDDLHPVGIFAHRILLELAEFAAGRIDGVAGHRIGELAHRQEIAAGRIDGEAARLLLGRGMSDWRERPLARIDLEARDRAGAALAGIEELAVRRQVKVGRPDLVRLLLGQRVHHLQLLQRAGLGVVGADVGRRFELVQQVDPSIGRMEGEVPWPGARFHRRPWGIVGRERSGRGIEAELLDEIAAEAGRQHEAVGGVGLDGVGVGFGRDDLLGRLHRAVGCDRIHRVLVVGIGRSEQEAAATVG